jgi:hypothetical protein
MILLGRLISLSLEPVIWERLSCQRTFATSGCRVHGNTTTAGTITIELDRPSLSPISRAVLLPICIDVLVGHTEGLLLELVEQAESHMATYHRLGIFNCSAYNLFDQDFLSQIDSSHLKAKVEESLTLVPPIKLV